MTKKKESYIITLKESELEKVKIETKKVNISLKIFQRTTSPK